MRKTIIFWALAFVLTIAVAYYQRITGPTYPVAGKASIALEEIHYMLEKSHSSSSNYLITLRSDNSNISGNLLWKRHKTNDAWTRVSMIYSNGRLSAELPKQPPAGKLQYKIMLQNNNQKITIPEKDPVVIRFKGDVPSFILIPHVLAMFGAMLLSTRTGLEYFNKEPELKKLTKWTLAFLIIGGMILGPLTQYFAFGEFWTGIPFGTDLTDNKTLIALVVWIIAAVGVYKSKKPKVWILTAAIILLIVFLIPHSMFGSELDYSTLKQ